MGSDCSEKTNVAIQTLSSLAKKKRWWLKPPEQIEIARAEYKV